MKVLLIGEPYDGQRVDVPLDVVSWVMPAPESPPPSFKASDGPDYIESFRYVAHTVGFWPGEYVVLAREQMTSDQVMRRVWHMAFQALMEKAPMVGGD